MKLLGNIVWLIFGGLFTAIEYFTAGIAMCLTIIGIPFGFQCFKLGLFMLFPFGQKTIKGNVDGGLLFTIMNIIWFFIGGLPIVLTHLFFGVLLAITIIGLPFAKQHFKLMSMAFTPFGRKVVSD
jgi:uncharacterized membrane protein YccF (DUF307 family)